MSKTKSPEPQIPGPSLAKLKRFFKLEELRKKAARQAKDLAKLQKEIADECESYVHEVGGQEKVAMHYGYRLYLKAVRDNVEWKKHYMEELGQEAAEKLIAAADTHDQLVIEPPPYKGPRS